MSGGAGTTWLVITLDKDGNEVSKRFHNGPKPAGRMATVETISMDAGTRILITTNGKVFCDVLVAEDGTLKDLKKTDFSVLTKHPTVDGAYVLASPKMVGAPAVTGDAEFKNDKLTVQLGQPIADGILPTEIKVDDKATATIEWYEADGTTKVTESVAEAGKTYTYKVTGLKAANGESVTAPVTVVTETGKTYEVSPYSFKSGVEIKTDGTMTTVPGSVTEVEQGGNSKDYKEVEKALTGNKYIVRWDTAKPNNTELKAMLDKDLKEVQKLDVKETKWNPAPTSLVVTLNNGATVTYTVELREQTKVFYNGEMAGWVETGNAQIAGVAKSAYLVAGTDENAKASVAVATDADGKATVPNAGSVPEVYLFDGVVVKPAASNPVTITHYKDADGKKTAMPAATGDKAVRPGTVLYITGDSTVASANAGKTISLMAGKTVVTSKEVEGANVMWVLPDTGVLAAWAEKGVVTFTESGASASVKLVSGATEETKTGNKDSSGDMKITGLPADSMWSTLKATDTLPAANVSFKANADGEITVTNTTFGTKNSVTLYRVYSVTPGTVATGAWAMKKISSWATSGTSTSKGGDCIDTSATTLYVAEGVDVVVDSKIADTFLKANAEKIPGFKLEKDLEQSGPKYAYSFKMPAHNIYTGNITAADTFKVDSTVSGATTASPTDTLNVPGYANFKVGFSLANADEEPTGLPAIKGWYTETAPASGKYVSASAPENLDTTATKVEAVEAGAKWTIAFSAKDGKAVPVGDYFFEVELDGMAVMAKLEVQKVNITTADGLKDQIAATPEGEKVTVGAAITGDVTIPSKAVVEVGASGSLTSPTVNGTLEITGGGAVTTPKLDGGKIVVGASSAVPTLAAGSKGELTINTGATDSTGVEDITDNFGGTVVDTAIAPEVGVKEKTVSMDRAGVKLSGSAAITGFDPGKTLDAYIAGNKGATSVSLYEYSLTLDNGVLVKGEKSFDGGKTWVAMEGVFGVGITWNASSSNPIVSLLANNVTDVRFLVGASDLSGGVSALTVDNATNIITMSIVE